MAHKTKPAPKLKVLADPKQQQPIDELQLIEQVGVWAEKNFRGKYGPDWGMFEEIGEAAHCVLKHRQGIRGFDDIDFFKTHLSDALADCIIYLAHWCYLHHAFFKFGRNQIQPESLVTHQRTIAVHLLQCLGAMFGLEEILSEQEIIAPAEVGMYNMFAQRMCNGIEYWAARHEIDLTWAVSATWAKVSGRDWIANPSGPVGDQV